MRLCNSQCPKGRCEMWQKMLEDPENKIIDGWLLKEIEEDVVIIGYVPRCLLHHKRMISLMVGR